MKRCTLPCLFATLFFGIMSCTEPAPTAGDGGFDSSSEAFSKKGGKPGGPAPIGTIYFYSVDPGSSTAGVNYSVDPDGNNRTDMLVQGRGTPSNDLHGGSLWFATTREVAGTYPDGNSRREVFLEKEGGLVSVQLTDQPDLRVREATWLPDDTALSFVASRFTGDPCEAPDYQQFIEGGIYTITIGFDGSGVPSPVIGSLTLLVSAPPSTGCEADIGPAVWAPSGDQIAFHDNSLNLIVGNIVSGSLDSPTTLTQGWPSSWSVQGEILFVSPGGFIHRIGEGGSGQTTVVSLGNNHSPANPLWSPDGNHFVYQDFVYRFRGNRSSFSADVYRVDRDGGGKKNLTGDLELSIPTGWR